MSVRTALVLSVLALVVGLPLQRVIHREQREAAAVAGASVTVALPALRCANGPEPRAWTRVEAEAKIHLVQVALDTALANSWNPRFRDWTEFAKANMELVKVCWGGEKP